MNWSGFNIRGTYYDLTHLSPFSFDTKIDENTVTLHVTFGHHCFTDEKENGPLIFKSDGRYWSHERYERTLQLPNLIREKLVESYAIAYISKKSNEQYHYTETHDYAIFFEAAKPENSNNELKIKVVSAYEIDQWGKQSLPKGSAKRVRWILSQRLQGKWIL